MADTRLHSDARPRPFHGWTMLGIAIAMAFATMPGQTVLVSLWKESIRESLGLSLTSVSAAYSIGTIIAALPLSWVGRAADRFGLRATVGVVAVGFALSLVLLREATGILSLGVGFFLVRFLGQGSLGMLSGHTVAMWFERRLGSVHALLTVFGFAAGGAIMPQPTAWLIASYGWRTALLALAGTVVMLVLPGVLFLFRNRPEEIGQHLDGDRAEHAHHDVLHGGAPPPGDPAFTARQAMRSSAYWILMSNVVATGFIGTALIFHMPAMLAQAGLEGSAQQAALAIQPWPIAFGVTTLGVGWLVDRAHPAKILPASLVLMAMAIALCLAATRGTFDAQLVVPVMAAGMGVYGASQAVITSVAGPTIARYFGRTYHGAIRGTVATATVMGTGAGPYAIALGHDLAGQDFTAAYLLCVALTLPLGVGAALLREPLPPRSDASTPPSDIADPSGPPP
ncbi:MAG TPA: MFS transporter [Thermoanaerobaculia bacterium]|nr:MFS transporter [Thermoanaerobaculia bacterium]